jgi:hypothetical protein
MGRQHNGSVAERSRHRKKAPPVFASGAFSQVSQRLSAIRLGLRFAVAHAVGMRHRLGQARQEHRRPDAQLWLAAPGQGYHRFPGRTRPAARCARRRRSQRAGHKGSFAARPGSPSVAPPLHMLPAPTRATADNPIRCRESIALSIDLAAWAANSAPASA